MLDGFEPLDDNEHASLGADPERGIMLLVRKRSGEVSAAELERAIRGALLTLGEPGGWGLLFDTRAAIGRSGPRFEAEAERLREYMLREFGRVAILVRTAIGEIQVERIRDRAVRMAVFRDLDAAIEFLSVR